MSRRRRAGKQAQATGSSLETYLEQVHTLLEARKRATVRKVPTPIKITASKGALVEGRKMPAEWADYAGTLANGRAVVFEAKAVGYQDDPRFYFGKLENKRGKGEDQIDVLARHASFGALAFVYVRHHRDPVRFADYVLPVHPDASVAGVRNSSDEHGSRSIRFEDAEPFKIGPMQDWHDVCASMEILTPGLHECRQCGVYTKWAPCPHCGFVFGG